MVPPRRTLPSLTKTPQKKVTSFSLHFLPLSPFFADQDDVETVVHNDVANMEDVIKEDDLSASLEEVSYPLELAIEEIRSMSVTSPQIITID